MFLTKEMALKLKEERRNYLKQLSIDEKIKRVEDLRQRVEVIRQFRRQKAEKKLAELQQGHTEANKQASENHDDAIIRL
jgi:hypothetical protein